jgi:Flp pilus assembly protein CpaB
VQVLHRRHAHGAGPGEGQAGSGDGRDAAREPEQSERLALASTEGKIQLALRNPMDQGAPETPGIKTAALVGVARAAAPRSVVASSSRPRSARSAAPVTQAMPVPEPCRR